MRRKWRVYGLFNTRDHTTGKEHLTISAFSVSRRTFHERRAKVSLPCEIVGLLQPGDQLFINVADSVHANAMGEQRIEACSGFESLSRGDILEDDSYVETRCRCRLDHRKLFFAPQADVTLLRCQFNVMAERR